MYYTLTELKDDLKNLESYDFYLKHIVKSYNWYFEEILGIPENRLLGQIDEFKHIVSNSLEISFNSVIMVGSGKIGYSLSPVPKKRLKAFNTNGKVRNISDIDIAVISDKLFHKYWNILRHSYKTKYEAFYSEVLYCDIYRGFINERILNEIEGCRREWKNNSRESKKNLTDSMFIKHNISYRLYRSWEDFEDYSVQSIKKLQREFNGENTNE